MMIVSNEWIYLGFGAGQKFFFINAVGKLCGNQLSSGRIWTILATCLVRYNFDYETCVD